MSSKKRFGFSLVELVIVIVIIGVIAAIAIPRMSRGASAAGESALVGNLAVLRNAIEMYATEHSGVFPGAKTDGMGGSANSAEALTNQLTKYSAADGSCSETKDAAHPFGPYLRKGIPPAPVGTSQGSTVVKVDATTTPPAVSTTGGYGWVYNPSTGDIIVNSNDLDASGGKNFNQY